LTRFICSLAIGISLLLIPQIAYADEVLIELTPDVAYVDTVVEVNGPTEYVIETTTGPRFEIAPSGINTERVAWVDSWIQLRQGEVVLRQDDDSNHNPQTNYYASKLTGTLDTGTYIIRATSYDYIVAGQRPIGTYTLTSNLIPPPPPPVVVEPEPEPEPIPEPVVEPTPDTTAPVIPDIVIVEPPITIPIPPEPPLINDIVPEEPPVPIEEPPAPAEEPPTEPEIAPVEEELPPAEVDTPPAEEEAPPAEAEEPPIEAEEPPPVVTEDSTPEEVEAAVEAIIEAADGEAITAEAIQEAGLTLEDLPSDTPIEIRTDNNGNAVVITAEVAVALQVFDSPAELVSAIFDDPGQVLTAVANIGADMSDEEREESEEIIVASVIAGQAAINAAGMAAGTATRTPTPSSPAGGPMAGNDKPKSARRRKP
jgi:hypothetical protein